MARKREVTDDEFKTAVENWPEGDNLPSTSDILKVINEEHGVDYDRKTVYRRLAELEENGDISKIEVGSGRGRSIGWAPEGARITITARQAGWFAVSLTLIPLFAAAGAVGLMVFWGYPNPVAWAVFILSLGTGLIAFLTAWLFPVPSVRLKGLIRGVGQ